MSSPQVITSGIDYLYLIVPVVIVLFGWIGAVLWADAHPDVRHVGSAASPAISGRSGAEAEATLAAAAADENQARSGERVAASDDAVTPAGPGQPARAADAEAGREGQG
jgi:hypothetical protein